MTADTDTETPVHRVEAETLVAAIDAAEAAAAAGTGAGQIALPDGWELMPSRAGTYRTGAEWRGPSGNTYSAHRPGESHPGPKFYAQLIEIDGMDVYVRRQCHIRIWEESYENWRWDCGLHGGESGYGFRRTARAYADAHEHDTAYG